MELFGLIVLFLAASAVLKSNIDMGQEEPLPWQKQKNKPPF